MTPWADRGVPPLRARPRGRAARPRPARARSRPRDGWWRSRCSCCPPSLLYACSCSSRSSRPPLQPVQVERPGPLTDSSGLTNYQRALADPCSIARSAHNVLIIVLSLASRSRSRSAWRCCSTGGSRARLFRLMFFAPYVLPRSSPASSGACSSARRSRSTRARQRSARALCSSSGWPTRHRALPLFVVISWKYFGFHMILMLAGLQGIPRELEEAAAIDGATRWQVFRYITLPLLGPTIRVSVFLSVIGALQLFDLVWVTTGGGPVNASNTMATTCRLRLQRLPARLRQRGRGRSCSSLALVVALALPALRPAPRHRGCPDRALLMAAKRCRRRHAIGDRPAPGASPASSARRSCSSSRPDRRAARFAFLGGFRTTVSSANPSGCPIPGSPRTTPRSSGRPRSGGSSGTAS